jgi:hypothetical protein
MPVRLISTFIWKGVRESAGGGERGPMKCTGVRCFYFLLSLFFQSVFAQIEWSEPIELGYGSSPDFMIDRQTGRLHVVIKKEAVSPPTGSGGVYYIVLDSLGHVLHQEKPVAGTESDCNLWDGGPAITVDKYSAPHVCYRQGNQVSGDWPYTIYYIRKTSSAFSAGWSNNIPVSINEPRVFNVRMTVEGENIVHIVRGTQVERIWGPIKYQQYWNGNKISEQTMEPTRYRNDNSFSIAADKNKVTHFVFGCPGIPTSLEEGTIKYYRALPGQRTMFYVTDLQKPSGMGRTCSPDLFPDQAGFIHFSYGSTNDSEVGGPAIRYVRYGGNTILNGTLVTLPGEMELSYESERRRPSAHQNVRR